MKHSQAFVATGSDKRSLSFWDFIRWAALLTLGASVPIIVIALFQWNVEVWATVPLLWLVTVVALWVGTLTVGCLVMIPVCIWRLTKRLAELDRAKTTPQGGLWDQWMDSPEPM